MKDGLENLKFYQIALEIYDLCWTNTEILKKDFRVKEIARQLIRSCGSISANIEEGYGRGFGKEYPHFLRISRGSARETKGWYHRSKFLLTEETISNRISIIDEIIAMTTSTITTLENRKKR